MPSAAVRLDSAEVKREPSGGEERAEPPDRSERAGSEESCRSPGQQLTTIDGLDLLGEPRRGLALFCER